MKNKRGSEMVGNETIELIVVAIGIALILIFAFAIYQKFAEDDETLKAYTSLFLEKLEKSEKNPGEVFSIYADADSENKKDVVMVYFGNSKVFQDENIYNKQFLVSSSKKNQVCFCRKRTADENKVCSSKYCKSLKKPIVYDNGLEKKDRFALQYGEIVAIVSTSDNYILTAPLPKFYFTKQEGSGEDLYFRFYNNQWQWSPEKGNWVNVPILNFSVEGITQKPKNIELIKMLENKSFEEGKKILLENTKGVIV
jgi:hypothetical protein